MTDLAALARRQYATLDPLAVRIRTHQLHTARPDDIEANVSRAVRLTSTDDLLDVGCGTGTYLRRLADHGLRRPRPAGEVGRGPRVMSVHDGNLPGMVEDVFGAAEVHRHDNELVFDTPEPVIAYTVSCLIGWGVPEEHPLRPAVIDTLISRAEAMFAGGRQVRDPKGYVIVTA